MKNDLKTIREDLKKSFKQMKKEWEPTHSNCIDICYNKIECRIMKLEAELEEKKILCERLLKQRDGTSNDHIVFYNRIELIKEILGEKCKVKNS